VQFIAVKIQLSATHTAPPYQMALLLLKTQCVAINDELIVISTAPAEWPERLQ